MVSLNKKLFCFTVLLSLNYLFIPSWLIIRNTVIRTVYFIGLLLLIIFSSFILGRLLKTKEVKPEQKITRFTLYFLIAAIFVAISQFFLLFQPITFTDEIAYISKGMYPFTVLNQLSNIFLHIPIILVSYLLLILLIMLFFLFKKFLVNKYYFKKKFLLISLSIISLILFVILSWYSDSFLSSFFTSKSLIDKLSWLTNGVQLIYYAIPFFFFGLNEFSSRISSLFFYIFSGYFFLKILLLLNLKKHSFYILLLFFFLPEIFYYGNLTFATAEIIFFIITASYFFLKHEKNQDQDSLFYFILLSTLMLFYDKKTNAFFLGILIFFIFKLLLIHKLNIKQFIEQNKTLILSMLFVIFVTLPGNLLKASFFYQTSLNPLNPYLTQTTSFLNLANWLSLFQSTRIFSNLSNQLNWLFLTVLIPVFIVILYYSFIKKDTDVLYFISIFLGYYIFFTSLVYNGLPRYTVPILFIFPIFYLYSIKKISINRPFLKKTLIIFTILLALFIMLSTLFLAYHNYQDRYLPVNQLFSYIKQELPNEKFLKTMAPSSYNFYIIKNNLNFNNFDPTIWEKAENQTFDNLYEYMHKNNISYFILPLPENSYDSFYQREYTTWLDLSNYKDLTGYPILNHSLVQDLYNDKSPKFKKVKEFNLGKNIIFIINRT